MMDGAHCPPWTCLLLSFICHNIYFDSTLMYNLFVYLCYIYAIDTRNVGEYDWKPAKNRLCNKINRRFITINETNWWLSEWKSVIRSTDNYLTTAYSSI